MTKITAFVRLSQFGFLLTEYHRLNGRNIFLIVLEVEKSKIKKQAELGSGGDPLSGS